MLTEGLVGGLRINRTRGQEDQPSIDVRGAGHRCPRRDRHGRRCTAHCVGSTNRSDHRRSDPRTDAGVPGVAGRALVRDEEPGEDRRRRRVSGLARLRRVRWKLLPQRTPPRRTHGYSHRRSRTRQCGRNHRREDSRRRPRRADCGRRHQCPSLRRPPTHCSPARTSSIGSPSTGPSLPAAWLR